MKISVEPNPVTTIVLENIAEAKALEHGLRLDVENIPQGELSPDELGLLQAIRNGLPK